MSFHRAVYLLFTLNLIDAIVTIVWVRTGTAPEANLLMASLLDSGVFPFVAVKVGMGVVTCVTLLYGSGFRLARIGVGIALFVYAGAMLSHILTGFAAYGYLTL